MTTIRMEIYGGRNYAMPMLTNIEIIAPGIGKMTCLECSGDPEGYAEAFGDRRHALAPDGYLDCKNRGWVYVSV